MTSLADLLDQAERATPGARIDLRDRIAAYGTEALPALTAWLATDRLGFFSARVIAEIAKSHRQPALGALRDAREHAPAAVLREIDDVLMRIDPSRRSPPPSRTPRTGRSQAEQWPGNRAVSPLELRFHDAMLDIFRLAGEATRRQRPDGTIARGYWASYFLRGVRSHGGPEYARYLLRKRGVSDGFRRLSDEGRLDLSVEALVLKPEYAELFTDAERRTAAHRLREPGSTEGTSVS